MSKLLNQLEEAAGVFRDFGPKTTLTNYQEKDGVKTRVLPPCEFRGEITDHNDKPCCGGKITREELFGCANRLNTKKAAWSVMCEGCRLPKTQKALEAVGNKSFPQPAVPLPNSAPRPNITPIPKKSARVLEGVKRLVLCCQLSPGDVTMMTVSLRDLHRAYPGKFLTDVRTSVDAIWEHNPYITKFDEPFVPQVAELAWQTKTPREQDDITFIPMEYPLVNNCSRPFHFIHGYVQHLERQLNLEIPVTDFKGDIYISDAEKSWMSQLEERGINDRFWIIMAGGKQDYTAKWWSPYSYQKVVDHFKGRITFVQAGQADHWHPPLSGVVNLVGQTDFRQFIRLVYHSSGVLCPVTFAMHGAAAIPSRHSPAHRPCVVISGGREHTHWEAYPNHRFLSLQGALPCCETGGCWKSRCTPIGDGDEKDRSNMCENFVEIPNPAKQLLMHDTLRIPKCMDMIRPEDVIRAIEGYYEGGVLFYNQ